MVICLWWHEGCHLKSVKFCADAFGLQTRLIPSIFRKKSCHTHLDALDVQNWFKDYDWVSKPGLSDASFVASHAFLQFHSFKIDTIGYNWFHFFFAFSLHRTRAVEAFRLKPLKPLKPRFHFSFSFIEDGLMQEKPPARTVPAARAPSCRAAWLGQRCRHGSPETSWRSTRW